MSSRSKSLPRKCCGRPGRKTNIQYLPLPPDDPKQRQPDISLARAKLDWSPKIPLAEGLKPTIAYFSSLLSAEARETAIRRKQSLLIVNPERESSLASRSA